MGIEVIGEGNLQANGNEQTLAEFTELGKMDGYSNLVNLVLDDTIVIRQYQKVYGTYGQYAEEIYSGTQVLPVIYITQKSGKNGIKTTLQQTVGTLRIFGYCFFKESIDKDVLTTDQNTQLMKTLTVSKFLGLA